ncbi:hypothetical protein LOD99_13091 [Oopsacas minuta]|uniref:Uracil-DNA glycosylase n=1 Tax=Oopsacas minuta TaxID=111878 RepID=A0AAV7JAV4_9METZ|nr:hypothetical protein LOD99_13091 [Oopsacas minuta]
MPLKRKGATATTSAAKKSKLTQSKLNKSGDGTVELKHKKAIQEVDYVNLRDLLMREDWKEILKSELESDYFKGIETFLNSEYSKGIQIFPPKEQIFNIFNIIAPNKVKVVILGQDPYHDDKQAHGLCFSVQKTVAIPPSLKNIYKELVNDIPGFKIPDHGCLDRWADQGVFLLNATLSVQAHKANSHAKCGWQKFTDAVIKKISEHCNKVVFILWGKFAENKSKMIDEDNHCIIISGHPSPLSVKHFLGCRCFSKANEYLEKNGKEPIDWKIPS